MKTSKAMSGMKVLASPTAPTRTIATHASIPSICAASMAKKAPAIDPALGAGGALQLGGARMAEDKKKETIAAIAEHMKKPTALHATIVRKCSGATRGAGVADKVGGFVVADEFPDTVSAPPLWAVRFHSGGDASIKAAAPFLSPSEPS